jgi:allantoinase
VQQIVEKVEARGNNVLGRGRTHAELVRPMWNHDEARAISECTDIIEKYVGVRPTGWMNDAIIRLPHDAIDGNERGAP